MPPVHWTGFLRIASACAAWSIASGTRDGRMNTLRADAAPLTVARSTSKVICAAWYSVSAESTCRCSLPDHGKRGHAHRTQELIATVAIIGQSFPILPRARVEARALEVRPP